MTPIEAALEEIKSLKPGEDFSYTEIARKHGVHRATLSRRWRAVSKPREVKAIYQRKLSLQQEQGLVDYIKELTKRGLPPTREMIRNFASQVAKEVVSDSWVTRFIKRQSIHLISQWTTGIDTNRHQADSAAKYSLYFDLLSAKIKEYDIEPSQMYNMDEKGFLIGITSRSKRVFSRQMWERKEVRAAIQDGSREWITLLACICADGSALPPGIIYQAANKAIRSSWVEDIQAGDHSVHIASSPSGWTNNDIGLAWLEQVFNRYTKKKARRSYRLLILDGHGSHITMDFIDYCDKNKILLAILPPHSTHTLQPLDVAMFKPLSTAYSTELSRYLQKSQGLVPIKKGDFFPLFWKAWVTSFVEKTILRSFEATGLSPVDPQVILQRFTTPEEQEEQEEQQEEQGESSGPSNWIKTEQLVRKAVKDYSTTEAKQLSQKLHSLQTQNELLIQENDGLREALTDKKKKKKSKTLDLQQRKEYHGGAVFWSPRKVREARVRQEVKEQIEKEEALQKANKKELQKAAKLYKEKIAEEKRIAREAAKVVREKEKAEKAAEKACKQEARNAAKALKLSQKGKRAASRPAQQATKPKKQKVDVVDSGEAIEATLTAPPKMSSTGRTIRLPSKYK